MVFTCFSTTSGFITSLIVLIIWTIAWKGVALWKAARNNSPTWFIVLFIVNTAGILEILYIFALSNKGKKAKIAKKSSKRKRRKR